MVKNTRLYDLVGNWKTKERQIYTVWSIPWNWHGLNKTLQGFMI